MIDKSFFCAIISGILKEVICLKKYNLPVILLKGLILLPKNTLKLEFDSKNADNNVIDEAVLFHDNYILVVNNYENNKIGILSKISNMIKLPNGNVRMDIDGLRRVKIIDYLNLNNTNEPLEALIEELEEQIIDNEQIIINKVINEFKLYVKNTPCVSDEVLNIIENEINLSNVIDFIVPTICNKDEIINFVTEIDVLKRNELLLQYIYQKKEIFKIEKDIDLKIKRELDDNQKEFFLREKMKLIKEELGDKMLRENEIDLLKERCKKFNGSEKIKMRIETEISRYENIPNMSPESSIIRDYIEYLLKLPYELKEENKSLRKVKEQLNISHYGLIEAKNRIIEYLAVKQISNKVNSPIICLVGPPGVGKTTLASSIASALNRDFVKISVNGIKDEAEILGHRKTYLGALPGRIITSMINAKTCNPVLLIDEIDKMSGERYDASATLLNILDNEQNKSFSDNYIEEEYDLSKVMFILTANYIENIPAPLIDRLEIIEINSYTEFEKLDIVKTHLLPNIINECNLNSEFIEISDEVILQIIRNYTKEAGVRELKRQIEKIIRKIVTQIVVNNIKINKIIITSSQLEKYLGKPKYFFNQVAVSQVGVVNGLAYTLYGGDVLPIEVNYYHGTGKLILTGSLGDVMKESAEVALDYLKSNCKDFNIDYNFFTENDIHIHVPEGAIKKDGPSAGIALTLALLSIATSTAIPNEIALTGEVTLRGNVLAIGGLKEKSIGALRSGIKRIFYPKDNYNDLDLLPSEVKDNIEFIPVSTFKDVLNTIKTLYIE